MKLYNNYLKIEPLENEQFVASETGQYDEMGTVLAVAEGIDVPIGSMVLFDSFMAKKFPVRGELGKFHWFIALDEIVAYE